MTDNAPPSITFAAFVSSFTATGAMAIQQIEQATSPGDGGAAPDMTQALATFQHLIETLRMLETKTSGNLTDDETKALEAALNDLKFGYMQIKERPAQR